MKIYLLTHERELTRKNNTGSIALKYASNIVERIIWHRVSPNPKLVSLINNDDALLLHPGKDATTDNFDNYGSIIIIDSTWQESRKIFNKSPYLKRAPVATLRTDEASRYTLRRNQIQGGFCTIECIIEVLKIKGEDKMANRLELEFSTFHQDRSRNNHPS